MCGSGRAGHLAGTGIGSTIFAMKPGDATTADLISTGCSMGIKSLARYCNQYPTASREAKDIAQSLIRLEDQLVKDMRPYL